MSTDKPWAHLPNAKHIDTVLADVRERPEAWLRSLDSLSIGVRSPAFEEALNSIDNTTDLNNGMWLDVCGAAKRAAGCDQVRHTAWDAATDTLAALMFWDSTADLLDCTPDVLRAMIDLAEPPVCHQAALLLPYAIVRMTK